MSDKTNSTSWSSKQTGIRRRKREDLVVRVFKPGIHLQQVLSKAERRKKDDKLLDGEDGETSKGQSSPLSISPRSLVSTPVEMYRKFWHGATATSQMTTNTREAEGKGRSESSSTTTSPRSFRPRWRLSRSFVGNKSPSARDAEIGRPDKNSPDEKDKIHIDDEQEEIGNDNDDKKDHEPISKAKQTLKRSDSVITVVRASSNDQKETLPTATLPSSLPLPPLPPLLEPYSHRPIYINGPIRLQEGALASFSARKDSIASLEAFLTAAAVEPSNPIKESRRASDDAAEKDIVSFFDSYRFSMGIEEDYRLDRFCVKEEELEEVDEMEEDYQAWNKDVVDCECIDEDSYHDDDDDDGDEKDSYCDDHYDNDNGNGNVETADMEFFFELEPEPEPEPENESESEVIEIALSEPLADDMLGIAVSC